MNPHYRVQSAVTSMRGFTLIETLLALALFALILAIGYQTIVATAESRNLLTERVDRQHALRAAHRTLDNAFSANGQLTGKRNQLEVDLSKADSRWLAGNRSITLIIDQDGHLLAHLDGTNQATILLDGLQRAGFRYFDQGVSYATWDRTALPDRIELLFGEGAQRKVWRFRSRQ